MKTVVHWKEILYKTLFDYSSYPGKIEWKGSVINDVTKLSKNV